MADQKLFMVLLGCRPPGRNTEQHDIFFGIAENIKDLVPQFKKFWPGAGTIHVDAWREVTIVEDHRVTIIPKAEPVPAQGQHLYFLNLGGYKAGEFDEFHYKLLVVASDQASAIRKAKQTAFYKHTGFKGAAPHIDDKFGVDVDELHQVREILSPEQKAAFSLQLTPTTTAEEDKLHLGYFPFNKL